MTANVPKAGAIVFVAAVAVSLASCGRRGPLEPPPGAAVPSAPLAAAPGGYGNPGETAGEAVPAPAAGQPSEPATPAAARVPKRPFALDPLL